MTDSTLLFVGHSHIIAIEDAWQARQKAGSAPWRASFLQLRLPDFRPDLTQAQDSPAFWSAAARAVMDAAAPDHVLSCIAGDMPAGMALVEHPQPFDFILDSAPELPVDESRQILPCALIEALMRMKMRAGMQTMRALKQAFKVPMSHLLAPPPVPSADFIARFPGASRERLQIHGSSPAVLRYKLWLMQARITEELCTELGIDLLPVPPQTRDEAGYLVERAWKDGTHGNMWYGRQVLRQLERHLRRVETT